MRAHPFLLLGSMFLAAAACGGSDDDGASGSGATGGSGGSAAGGSGGSSASGGSGGGAGSGGATECPLGPEAKELVNELMQKLALDASFVSFESHSSPSRIALALSLVGTSNGFLASFTPIETCTADSEKGFEPYCSPVDDGTNPAWATNASCSRWGCDTAGQTLVEVWYVGTSQTTVEPRHVFSYPFEPVVGSSLEGRAATVEWARNPYLLWTRTDAGDGSLHAVADGDHAVKVTFDDGLVVDLSHEAHAEFDSGPDGQLVSLRTSVVFSAIAGSDVISGNIDVLDPVSHVPEGSVVLNGFDVLAVVTQSEEPPPRLEWQGVCAP